MHCSVDRENRVGALRDARWRLIALLVGGGMLAIVGAVSPVALLVVLLDGSIAAGVVLSATGLGLWIVRGLRLHRADLRWQLLLAAGLGLGAVSLLVLGLGVLGVLHRWVWVSLLAVFAAGGLWRVRDMRRDCSQVENEYADGSQVWMRWLWLGVIGFGALALLGGTMPPGILWPAEGNGYDVLEYHLGVPREYFEAGRISYLPHNIYSNFPLGVESLYLLTIILRGDPVGAVFSAKLLNVLLGMLAVGGVWLAGREFGRGSGVVAGLIAASCPFLTYLSGVAYVENGLLFLAALALGALLRAWRDDAKVTTLWHRRLGGGNTGETPMQQEHYMGETPVPQVRWILASGLLCGLACGCKYTAIPAVFLPLLIAVTWHAVRRQPRQQASRTGYGPGLPVVFLLGWAVAFGPWMVKNVAMTGNPVFPLARGAFQERPGVWNEDDAARWHEGHLPAPEDRPWGRRVTRLWHEVIASSQFGPGIVLAIAAGIGALFARRRGRSPAKIVDADPRGSGVCWLMIIIGAVFWMGWTHLVGRFAIVLVVPAAVLAGCCWRLVLGRNARTVVVVLLVVAFNLFVTVGQFTEWPFLESGAFGSTALMTEGIWPGQKHVPRLNSLVSQGHRVLMIGDARRLYLNHGVDYCVVFNRNPFAEAAESRSAEDLTDWLREQDYSYVYVDWGEMWRLRGSRYGFWPSINEGLFARLVQAGLTQDEVFAIEEGSRAYATLFKVPQGSP